MLAFGRRVVPAHYAPLIGPDAAERQVLVRWTADRMDAAIAAGLVLVAEKDGRLVGIAEHDRLGDDDALWKLCVAPSERGRGLGARLLRAVEARLPDGARRLFIEHVAANERAGAFSEREGFAIDRVEPSWTGDPALDLVWRLRMLPDRDPAG